MILIQILLCLASLAILVPVLVLLTQVVLALPPRKPREVPSGNRPTVAVLVPAHDEAAVIADALRTIAPNLLAGDRLLVVADNCSDDTARIAAASGAEVIERHDPLRRGKGYALDFGVRHLNRNPPGVVVVIDADCSVEPGAIDRISRICLETGRPIQARYVMRSDRNSTAGSRIAEFAWLVKDYIRPLGLLRLGLPCQLMGTGMALPWSLARDAQLGHGHIVEDLILGIDLAQSGKPPLFCPEARVASRFPNSREGVLLQRTRWEHGHLETIFEAGPGLFAAALVRCDVNLLAMALDLCVPPLALLLLGVLTVFVGGGALFALTRAALPLAVAALSLLLFGAAVLLAWVRYGRDTLTLKSLAYVPVYALSKIPLYLRFVWRRQTNWVRSRRDGR